MSTKITFSILAIALCATASAGTIVDILSTVSGCTICNAPTSIEPGTTFASSELISPVTQSFGAGTYTFINADPLAPGGTPDTYSAWAFNGSGNGGNWVWSFVVASVSGSTATILMDDYTNGTESTQSAQALLTGTTDWDGTTLLASISTAGFTDSLTLASTTTLYFFVDDYYLLDNAGGVALNITQVSGVPEPSSFALLAVARPQDGTRGVLGPSLRDAQGSVKWQTKQNA
jgi:hypothetical protein